VLLTKFDEQKGSVGIVSQKEALANRADFPAINCIIIISLLKLHKKISINKTLV